MGKAKKRKPAKKSFRVELSKLALAGWCFGLLLALFWMFLLGVFVGKGITPANINLGEIKRKMMAEGVWPGFGKTQEETSSSQSAKTRKKIPLKDLEFYEELNKKKRARLENLAKDEAPTQKKPGATATPQTARLPKKETSSAKERKRYPNGFTVQVASFRDLASAEKFATQLKDLKHRTTIMPVDLPGKGRWYRVQVGKLSSHDEATALARRLSARYHLQSFVLPAGG
jgi:septal ring-binding cell division protein DamX